MSVKNKIWAMGYSVFQILQGQLIHPYPTMRQLVRDKVFLWMTCSPIGLWLGSLLIWKLLELTLFSLFPYQGFWLFLALWFTVGIALYQLLLVYLLVRFLRARV
ncbi:MAG TPA: hypothetical protein VJ246_01195 [Patescibacteria group bacterium]|nr:hypothetical protein [Patescibacteria group bacterium]